jgi:hypothetical protein
MGFEVDVIEDRVQQSVVVGGLGNVMFNGGGLVNGFSRFGSVMTIGQTTWYFIYDPTGFGWEVGIGTYAAGDQLQRTTVIDSTNDGALVNFPGNTCQVAMTIPARFVSDPGAGSSYTYGTISWGAGSVATNGTIVLNGNLDASAHALLATFSNGSGGGSIVADVQCNGTSVAGWGSVTIAATGTVALAPPGVETPEGSAMMVVFFDAAGTISDGGFLTLSGTED